MSLRHYLPVSCKEYYLVFSCSLSLSASNFSGWSCWRRRSFDSVCDFEDPPSPGVSPQEFKHLRASEVFQQRFLVSGEMHLFYTLALVLAMACFREARAHCRVKFTDTANCVVDLVCYGEVSDDDTLLPSSCDGKLRIRLALKSAGMPPASCATFLDRVYALRAAGNKWGRSPDRALRCTPQLQSLMLPGNLIPNLTAGAFSNLTALRFLDLSANSIDDIHVDVFSDTPRLVRLLLADNRISTLHDGTFEHLRALELLDLSHNSLMRLNRDIFRGLAGLKTLLLNNNKIIFLNGTLKRLHGLEHLHLRENKLHHVDVHEIPNFRQLQTLDFTNNTLSAIQPEVFLRLDVVMESSALRDATAINSYDEPTVKILLSRNKIAVLENASFVSGEEIKSRSVRHNQVEVESTTPTASVPTEIDLSHNVIEKIEYDAFKGINKLISLDVSSNRLTVFKINTTNLNDLRRLNLQNNYMTVIDAKTFYELSRLATIDISANKIGFLPDYNWVPRDLTTLDVSENSIDKLDASSFGKLESISTLDASRNRLTEVYIRSAEFGGLERLSLHSNNISDLSLVRLEYLLELKFLDLSRNRIKILTRSAFTRVHALKNLDLSSNVIGKVEASAFSAIPGLVKLDLSGNNLTHVEFGVFSGLGKLEELDLSRNRIGQLESRVLFDLHSLKRLDLEHNGLRAMDVDVWKGRRVPVMVSVGGNRFACSWLADTLKDADHRWSGAWLAARPTGAGSRTSPSSAALAGITCDDMEPSLIAEDPAARFVDDRLLYTNEKILNAILMQTHELKKALKMLSFSRLRAKPLPERRD